MSLTIEELAMMQEEPPRWEEMADPEPKWSPELELKEWVRKPAPPPDIDKPF
jgi:hypothetical protein